MENQELKGYFTAGYNDQDNVMFIDYIEPWTRGESFNVWTLEMSKETATKLHPILENICESLTEKLS